MLNRASSNKKFVDEFVYELGVRAESIEARKKIDALMLTDSEWDHVGMFFSLLHHLDKAQHAFSAAQTPTLFNAIPAIEALHMAWSSHANKLKYNSFKDALCATTAKLNEYYEKTADSDARILVMLLHPEYKMTYFKKNWNKSLQKEVLELGQNVFKEHYELLRQAATTLQMSSSQPPKQHKT
ncbi:hypothetical protein BC826DRAFT_1110620 [Russula brevipes]|nr:hypothetical protein BC826DRAFT_1110620 [Russula brevipes]